MVFVCCWDLSSQYRTHRRRFFWRISDCVCVCVRVLISHVQATIVHSTAQCAGSPRSGHRLCAHLAPSRKCHEVRHNVRPDVRHVWAGACIWRCGRLRCVQTPAHPPGAFSHCALCTRRIHNGINFLIYHTRAKLDARPLRWLCMCVCLCACVFSAVSYKSTAATGNMTKNCRFEPAAADAVCAHARRAFPEVPLWL